MQKLHRRHLLAVALLLAAAVPAHAAERVALVIGNGSYQNGGSLRNPKNDAALISGKLKALRYDQVLHFTDVTTKDFKLKLAEFKTVAFQADVAVFYFAGHGMEVDGVNYLLPIDSVLAQAADLKQEAIALPEILKLLDDTQVKAKIIVLDCYRNNPFGTGAFAKNKVGLAAVTKRRRAPSSCSLPSPAKKPKTALMAKTVPSPNPSPPMWG